MEAEQALINGDPELRLAMTSTQDPVTVFGAKVPVRRGWDDVSGTIRWLASRWSNCTDYRFELVTAGVSGDLAYPLGFDHLANSVNDVQVEPYTLREMVHRARRAACASTAYVCVVDRDFRVGLGSAPPLGFQFGSRSDLSTTSRPPRVPGLSA